MGRHPGWTTHGTALLVAALILVATPAAAQNCNIFTGGNPCNDGCPDECSPILCPGNRLCHAECGGSGCNIGCSPGPCGDGCPDECSPILCPQNPCACAERGEFCVLSANCCDDLVCAFPQQVCRHDPPELGEPCGPLVPCRAGLRCILLTCQEPRKIGEGCLVGSDCADGLDCRPCFVDGCRSPLMCFPRGAPTLYDEQTCRGFHSPALGRAAIDAGVTMSYGFGSELAAGVAGSYQMGTVYGQDGSYGCFLSTCVGAIVDAQIGSFVCVGFQTAFADFAGSSVAIVEEAGEGLAFSTAQIIGPGGGLVGTEDCLSIEASLAPITAGVFDCDTTVNAFSVSTPTTTSTTTPGGVTTTTATSTTSTTLPALTVPSLLAALARTLPDPTTAERPRKRLADKLGRLHRRAEQRLVKALSTAGSRQRRLYAQADRALRMLRHRAERGAAADRLGVPLMPIQAIVAALRTQIAAPRGGGSG